MVSTRRQLQPRLPERRRLMSFDLFTALPRPVRTALINREFARLWCGQGVSAVGDMAFGTTLVLWVGTVLAKGKPWAPAAVSAVLLAEGAAVLLVGPLAGVFVDRWNSRLTMLRTDMVRCALAGLLGTLAFLPAPALPVWAWLAVICTVVFALNVGGQFFGPAQYAAIAELLTGEEDRARAASIGQATTAAALITGPPLAAPLLFGVGLPWALLFNAATYAVSFTAIRSMRLGPHAGQQQESTRRAGLRAEFAAGLRFFAGSRLLVALLALAVVATCGLGLLNALDVFFVTKNLRASPHVYGYLGAAFGLGAIVGALVASHAVRRFGARTTTWVSLIVEGVLVLGYSRQTTILGGVTALFLCAVPMTMLNTAMTPLLMSAAPRQYLGRVVAVFTPANQLAAMLSTLVAGWLASSVLRNFAGSLAGVRFGPIDTIYAVSGLLVIAAGVCAWAVLPEPTPGRARQAKASGAAPAGDAAATTPQPASPRTAPRLPAGTGSPRGAAAHASGTPGTQSCRRGRTPRPGRS
jgi:MFS family permease